MTNSATMLHLPMVSGPNTATVLAMISSRRFSANSVVLSFTGIAGRFCIMFSDLMNIIFYWKMSVDVVLVFVSIFCRQSLVYLFHLLDLN